MNNLAQVIKLERSLVKADTDEGFIMLANSINTELGKFGVYRLNGRERALIDCIIDKTFKYKKKVDWISESQFSEFMGMSNGSIGNINKIKNSLIKRNILISEGRKVGLNTTLSQWQPPINQSKTTGNKTSRKQPVSQSKTTSDQSNPTCFPVESDPHNRKTILQKTINTIDKPTKRNTQIPNDFCITEKMRAWSLSKNHTINIDDETENFILYWKGAGKTKADWTATWQVWMNKNNKDNSPRVYAPRKTFRDQITDRNIEVMNDFVNGGTHD